MRTASTIIAALSLCAATQAIAQTRTITSVTEEPRDCPLSVSFGSYAMGIEGRAFDRVATLLTRDRGVRAVEQYRWGREGEVTLCARTRSASEARRLFSTVRLRLPARPRGPITLTAGLMRYVTPRLRR